MDSNYTDNPNEMLLTILAGFNELVRNAYISGFKDGQEFEIKLSEEETRKLSDEKANKYISELNSNTAKVLLEAEQILVEYS
ncbi:MAG: hypothetical protein JSU79_03935 [Dehalococcoidales bacterium]|nr:MAG: hypothetical protein JSU79_03935 [Dehalococcoidales bacterium]